jgi:CRISPR-associated endonuclease/helicase Cas3
MVESDDATDVGSVDGALPFRVRAARDSAAPSDARSWRTELGVAADVDEDGSVVRSLVVESRRGSPAGTEDGRSTTPSRAQLLVEHEEWTERHALNLAQRLGLPPHYAAMLGLAARLHDEGKSAARWQRAFRAAVDGPWAKTTARPNIQLLDGYRHEFGSLPRAERDPRVGALDDGLRDLCLHLIAAHHGFARPIIATDGCEDAPPSALVARAQSVALRFARLERRWGPWGLAWWESLLRAADQQASRENDERGDHG